MIELFLFLITSSSQTMSSADWSPKSTIDEIFNTLLFEEVTQQPLSGFGALQKCGENDLDVCVPYYDCDPITNTVLQDTNSEDYNPIDINFRMTTDHKCDHFLDVCCKRATKLLTLDKPSVNKTNIPSSATQEDSSNSMSTTTGSYEGSSVQHQLEDNSNQGNDGEDNAPKNFESYYCGNWSNCGMRNADGISFKLSGNMQKIAEYGEFPWQVLLLMTNYNKRLYKDKIICGGSIIRQSIVLTAAHCVKGFLPFEITVRAGEWDMETTIENIPYQERLATKLIIHEDFNDIDNDIALIFLDRPYIKVKSVGSICLPKADHSVDTKNCFASGWGKINSGRDAIHSVLLKKIEPVMMSHSDCQKSLRKTSFGSYFPLYQSFICATGDSGIEACEGDEGGPLVCSDPDNFEKFTQTGIISRGLGCHTNRLPGFYTDVAKFTKWIDEKLRAVNSY